MEKDWWQHDEYLQTGKDETMVRGGDYRRILKSSVLSHQQVGLCLKQTQRTKITALPLQLSPLRNARLNPVLEVFWKTSSHKFQMIWQKLFIWKFFIIYVYVCILRPITIYYDKLYMVPDACKVVHKIVLEFDQLQYQYLFSLLIKTRP